MEGQNGSGGWRERPATLMGFKDEGRIERKGIGSEIKVGFMCKDEVFSNTNKDVRMMSSKNMCGWKQEVFVIVGLHPEIILFIFSYKPLL